MKKNRLLFSLILAGLWLANTCPLPASGSYTSRPPRPGVEESTLDRSKYALGQRIFNNKFKLETRADAGNQENKLQRLQSSLPKKVAKKKDLTTLAGKLTDEQLAALEYYVNQRYAN